MPMSTKNHGFTLIELMAVLTLAAIILTIGVPSFQEIIRNNRFATQANTLISSINLARSEAVKRGTRVTLCKSSDGQSCATNDGYEQGWIVFTDVDDSASFDSGTEEIIRVVGSLSGGSTLRATSDAVVNYVSYVADGTSKRINGNFQAGTIQLCKAGKNTGRQIVINSIGRPKTEEANCS